MKKLKTKRVVGGAFLNIMLVSITLYLTYGCSYIAAQAKGAEPQIFESGIISTGHEYSLTFSSDLKEVFFTKNVIERKLNHIMWAEYKNGKWREPVPISFSDDQWSDLDPAISPNGKRLFFLSSRPVPGAQDAKTENMDLWYSDRVGGSWGKPRHLENVNSPARESSPTVSRDGTLCFSSDKGRAANSNSIYCSELRRGVYGEPKRLESGINSEASDASPFLTADGKILLFYSTRPSGYGQGDLYVSFRQNNGWSSPTNLGPIVNTTDFEYNPIISPDGKTLYFGKKRNLYWIPVDALNISGLGSKVVRSN